MRLTTREGKTPVKAVHTLGMAVLGTLLTVTLPVTPGHAAGWDAEIDTLMRFAPESTRADVVEGVESLAGQRNESPEQTAEFLVAEVTREARESGFGGSPARSSSSSGQCPTRARDAKHRGDILWTAAGPAGTTAWNHVALYTEPNLLTEAPGTGKNTRRIRAAEKCVSRNWARYDLKDIPWSAREKAKTWAHAHLGRPYKKQFWNNKKIEDTHYNCSQFVWAAYKTSGYDLDSDGGPGVYPDDIRDSRHLVRY